MNWTGGGRSTIRMRAEQQKQREHFQKQRQKNQFQTRTGQNKPIQSYKSYDDIEYRSPRNGDERRGAAGNGRSLDLLGIDRVANDGPIEDYKIRKQAGLMPGNRHLLAPQQAAQFKSWSVDGADQARTERETDFEFRPTADDFEQAEFDASRSGYLNDEFFEDNEQYDDRYVPSNRSGGPRGWSQGRPEPGMQVTRRTPKRALDVEPSEFEVGQRPSPLKQMRAEDPMPAPERRSERARSSNNSRYTFSSPIAKDRPASLLSEAPDRFRHIEPDESMLQYEQEERASVAPSQRAAASDRSTASHETPRKSHGLSIPAISSSRNSGSAHHEGERPAIAAVQQGMLGRKGATTGSSPSVFFDPRTHGGRPLLLGSDVTDLEPGIESKSEDRTAAVVPVAQPAAPDPRWEEFELLKTRVTSLEAENKKLKFDMSRLKVDAMELAQVIVDLRSEMQDKAAAAVIQELPTKGDQDRIDVPPISAEAATEKEAPVDVPEEPEAKDARDSLNYLAEMLFPELHSPKQIEGVGDHQIEVDEIEDDIPPKEDDPSLSPVL